LQIFHCWRVTDAKFFLSFLARFSLSLLQRVMLQWLDLDDLEGLAALAEAVM
jgi:hypothetical protein